eukprot:2798220-Heterocapsa_arctica.AAC.1
MELPWTSWNNHRPEFNGQMGTVDGQSNTLGVERHRPWHVRLDSGVQLFLVAAELEVLSAPLEVPTILPPDFPELLACAEPSRA